MAAKSSGKLAATEALRAMKAQRAEELAGQVDPAVEARRREERLLASMTSARDDFDWLAANQGWLLLGFDTMATWWAERVQPVAELLALRPAPDMARKVVQIIVEEESTLPAAQRRSKKEIAALVGVHRDTVSGRKRQDQPRAEPPHRSDLGDPAPADIPAALGQAIADTAASVGAGVDLPPARPVGVLCWSAPDREHCAGCGKPIPMHEQNSGTLRCSDCDPIREHYAVGIGVDEGHGECDACTRLVRLAQDPAAVTAESPEPGPNGLGEPAGADKATVLAGTPTGDGLPSSPVGDQDSPAADPIEPSHAGVPAVGGQERIEEDAAGDWVDQISPAPAEDDSNPHRRCSTLSTEPCPTGQHVNPVRPVLVRQQYGEPQAAELWERNLTGRTVKVVYLESRTGAWVAVDRIIDSPAADLLAPPSPQQPGQDSPPDVGSEGFPRRAETDHQQVAGVSPAGEAPAPPVAVEPELEDGGNLPSSSSSDSLMAAFASLVLHLAGADPEALGPVLHDDDVELLLQHADDIENFVGRLIKARTPEVSR